MKGYQEEVLQAGCTAYLTKPIDIDALLQQVAQLLGAAIQESPQESTFVMADSTTIQPTEAEVVTGPIRSRFADNAKLAPIVRKFAGRLHQQLRQAQEAVEAGDLPEVARLAHWLAGAAGTMGYDAFTDPAREMEAAAKAGDASLAEGVLQRLSRMADQLDIPEIAIG